MEARALEADAVSQASARSQPPAAASPLTMAIAGMSQLRMLWISGWTSAQPQALPIGFGAVVRQQAGRTGEVFEVGIVTEAAVGAGVTMMRGFHRPGGRTSLTWALCRRRGGEYEPGAGQ